MEYKKGFSFTYSAAQQQEVEEIRKKYLPKEDNKLEKLRKLHNGATQKAQAAALVVGVLGALILGLGMSLIMTPLGKALGYMAMVLGIPTGLLGIGLVALAYPVYNRVLQKQRQRIAPEILRLTDELMNHET